MNLIMIFFLLIGNVNTSILNIFLLVHGVLSAFFFFLIDQVQKRTHTRNLTSIGGLGIYTTFLVSLIWGALLIFRGFPVFVKFIIE